MGGGFDDMYRIFLVETPIGPYFEEYLKEAGTEVTTDGNREARAAVEYNQVGGILTKQDLEIMKATLKKAWLEDFNKFCQGLGGSSAEVMGHILNREADFRVLLVTLNALNTKLGGGTGGEDSKLQDRNSLYPNFGYLYPEGTRELRKVWNETTTRAALEPYAKYLAWFDQVKQNYDKEAEGRSSAFQSIEDLVYTENVYLYEMAFEQQYHFGIFYAWVKLREQEIRNIRWIANMVVLNTKEHIDDTIVPIFQPRLRVQGRR